jgi:hypothetical protein
MFFDNMELNTQRTITTTFKTEIDKKAEKL